MITEIVSIAQLQELVNSNERVVVDCYTGFCVPCKTFKPVFIDASNKYTNVTFCTCNVEDDNDVAEFFKVKNVPMILFFENGQQLEHFVGSLNAKYFDELLNKRFTALNA